MAKNRWARPPLQELPGLGELMAATYEDLLASYGDPDTAAVATVVTVNNHIAAHGFPIASQDEHLQIAA